MLGMCFFTFAAFDVQNRVYMCDAIYSVMKDGKTWCYIFMRKLMYNIWEVCQTI